MSTDTNPTVFTAFVAAQAQLTHAVKDAQGQARGAKYKYAELSGIVEMIRPILASHGLAFQSINAPSHGGALVRSRLIHESGGMLESDGTFVPAGDIVSHDGKVTPAGAQQYGSAYTYARRYDLLAFLGIAADDDDGAAAMQQHAARVAAASVERVDERQKAILVGLARLASPTSTVERLDIRYRELPAADFPMTLDAGLDASAKGKRLTAEQVNAIRTGALSDTPTGDILAIISGETTVAA